jgi:hypothetical protein
MTPAVEGRAAAKARPWAERDAFALRLLARQFESALDADIRGERRAQGLRDDPVAGPGPAPFPRVNRRLLEALMADLEARLEGEA